jgi:hypothetical protein
MFRDIVDPSVKRGGSDLPQGAAAATTSCSVECIDQLVQPLERRDDPLVVTGSTPVRGAYCNRTG